MTTQAIWNSRESSNPEVTNVAKKKEPDFFELLLDVELQGVVRPRREWQRRHWSKGHSPAPALAVASCARQDLLGSIQGIQTEYKYEVQPKYNFFLKYKILSKYQILPK